MTETWAEIPGHEGREVSSLGRVRALKNGAVRMQSPTVKSDSGYVCVSLGRNRLRYVHRLVLEAFIGPCPDGMQACHGNGIRSDNRLENLRWDTSQANHDDKADHGTVAKGSALPQAKLTEVGVAVIKDRLSKGDTQVSLASRFGVSKATINDISRNKTWSHV